VCIVYYQVVPVLLLLLSCGFLVMLDWQVTWWWILLQMLLYSYLTVPHSDYNSLICNLALRQWQLRWNFETENKLHAIKPRVNVVNLLHLPCQDEIIIHRLRIWPTFLM